MKCSDLRKKIIVAIDGHSSCGKSTMAKQLAAFTGYTYVDTGAMYRSVALYALQHGLMTDTTIDEIGLKQAMSHLQISFKRLTDGTQHIALNGDDVEHLIRTLQVSDAASKVSSLPFVRTAMVEQQQQMGLQKGIVMDGRDIGTVVFPKAELKVFVTASAQVRAQRRYDELIAKGEHVSYEAVLANVLERDKRDTARTVSPLRQASDALLLDNSHLNRDQQFELLYSWFLKATDRGTSCL